jgi:hypothetical protein
MDVLEDHLEGKAMEFCQMKRKACDKMTLVQAMEALTNELPVKPIRQTSNRVV